MHYQIHAVEGVRLNGPIDIELGSDRDAVEHARMLAVDLARVHLDQTYGIHFAVEDENHNLVGSVAVKFLDVA